MNLRIMAAMLGIGAAAFAQEPAPAAAPASYVVETGTRVPLALITSVSTKNAAIGDRVYLETVFPIIIDGKVVIPPGSYVNGTVTQVKRPGRVKGRGELFVRFDSLSLPNGVTRTFKGTIGAIDGTAAETLDRAEGKVKGDTDKGGDAQTVAGAAGAGASIGAIAARTGTGAAMGGGAGAVAGLVGVLLQRGPDATLARGSTLEMILDRNISFTDAETDFSGNMMRRTIVGAPAATQQPARTTLPLPGRLGL